MKFDSPPKATLDEVLNKKRLFAKKAKFSSPAVRKKFLNSISDDEEFFYQTLDNGDFMYNDTCTIWLKQLLDRIVAKNPKLSGKKYNIFTLRKDIANAYSFGEGLLLFTLPMTNKMRMESEIAYILCHELAHDFLDHSNSGYLARLEIENQKDYKIFQNNMKYRRYYIYKQGEIERLSKLFRARSMRHNQAEEYQADSLGLIFLTNAGFSPSSAISQLTQLDSTDYLPNTDFARLKAFFTLPGKTFDESLTISEESNIDIGNSNQLIPDSLKTHPECELRKKAAERVIENANLGIANDPLPDKNGNHFLFEEAMIHFEHRNVSKALYFLTNIANYETPCKFRNQLITICLTEIYQFKKLHALNSISDQNSKTFPESYNKLLLIIYNIGLSDLDALCKLYEARSFEQKDNSLLKNYLDFIRKAESMKEKEISSEINKIKPLKEKKRLFHLLTFRYAN